MLGFRHDSGVECCKLLFFQKIIGIVEEAFSLLLPLLPERLCCQNIPKYGEVGLELKTAAYERSGLVDGDLDWDRFRQ